MITISQITSQYLYGSATVPSDRLSDTLIRLAKAESFISQEVNEYMKYGGGRFALPSEFPLVQAFFSSAAILEAGEYTKEDLGRVFGLKNLYISLYQSDWNDGKADYDERVYIWQSGNFKLTESTRFVVDGDGHKYITGLGVEPFEFVPGGGIQRIENFDFVGGNLFANIGVDYALDFIDPSRVGRKVKINFTGNVELDNYYDAQEMAEEYSKITIIIRLTVRLALLIFFVSLIGSSTRMASCGKMT